MSRKGKAKVLNKDEFDKLEEIVMYKKYSNRNRAMIYLSFGLGLRACEIRDLRLGDVITNEGKLKETVNLIRTKGGKAREIYLKNEKMIEVMSAYIFELRRMLERKIIPYDLNLPLFLSQKGGRFFSNGITILLCEFFKLAGIYGAKSHSGRRTFITNRINDGFDIKSISVLVGHSSIKRTLCYYETNPERLKKISEKNIF